MATDLHIEQPESLLAAARAVLEQESAAVAALAAQLDEQFVSIARLILSCEGHVFVAGAGTSHAVGARLAHLLTCCGTPAVFIHPGDSQHGLAGAITAKDVLIALSKGGETSEVNFLCRYARARGVKVIAFTEKMTSTLAGLSDAVLLVRPLPGIDPFGMIATGSSLVTAAMGDALCVILLKLRGYTRDSFAATHPGGAVGRAIEAEGISDQTNNQTNNRSVPT